MEVIASLGEKKDIVASYRENNPEWENLCVNQLIDDDHLNRLKAMNFDLAITDIFPFTRCMVLIPYVLGIPYVGIETQYEPWMMRTPAMPSFVPNNNFRPYTPNMNFWQRLDNLYRTIDWFAFPGVTHFQDDFVKTHIRDKPFIPLEKLFGKCLLFLTDTDPILDYPRPQLPNEITVGGMTTKPVKALPADLQQFMDAAEGGVILLSFGSYIYDLGPELLAKFFSAFKKANYQVIMKYQEEPEGLPSNVKVMPWLPQNDLLGHRNTKIFVTHCGNNGQFEGLYHAVPMIGYPMFGDQPHNCLRLPYHGFGKCLDPLNFHSDDLYRAIMDIMTNASYRESIQLASAAFQDSPMNPRQRAGYWVEHVMKYGGKHLRSHGLDMAWYEYLMVDILVFVLSAIILLLTCVLLACYRLMTYLKGERNHQKTE